MIDFSFVHTVLIFTHYVYVLILGKKMTGKVLNKSRQSKFSSVLLL